MTADLAPPRVSGWPLAPSSPRRLRGHLGFEPAALDLVLVDRGEQRADQRQQPGEDEDPIDAGGEAFAGCLSGALFLLLLALLRENAEAWGSA